MQIVCARPMVFRRRLLKYALRNASRMDNKFNTMRKVGVIDPVHRKESMIAWDIVEELSSEVHRFKNKEVEDPIEMFCTEEPDALECRMYDV